MLYKTVLFKNVAGESIKVTDIPVVAINNPHYFMIQARLQTFISSLYNHPQVKSCYSFRDYLKQRLRWPDYTELFSVQEFKNNA